MSTEEKWETLVAPVVCDLSIGRVRCVTTIEYQDGVVRGDNQVRWERLVPPPIDYTPGMVLRDEDGVLWTVQDGVVNPLDFEVARTSFGRVEGLSDLPPHTVVFDPRKDGAA